MKNQYVFCEIGAGYLIFKNGKPVIYEIGFVICLN